MRYGRDNIDTDVIIPGQYLKVHDYDELATHAMEGLDPDFHKRMERLGGTGFVVAGRNFGCGSSREHAPIALSRSGVRAVVAVSFARIFYRNCVDGAFLLPIEVGEDAYGDISDGDEIEIDTAKNRVVNVTRGGKEYATRPFDDIISGIIEAGGLFKYRPDGRG